MHVLSGLSLTLLIIERYYVPEPVQKSKSGGLGGPCTGCHLVSYSDNLNVLQPMRKLERCLSCRSSFRATTSVQCTQQSEDIIFGRTAKILRLYSSDHLETPTSALKICRRSRVLLLAFEINRLTAIHSVSAGPDCRRAKTFLKPSALGPAYHRDRILEPDKALVLAFSQLRHYCEPCQRCVNTITL
jgi:hypothetical protein